MTNYTSGPWKVVSDRTANGKPFTVIVGGDKNEVLICEAPNALEFPKSYEAFKQNGALIAAAPQLLEALKGCVKVMEPHMERDGYLVICVGLARAAIAQVEGKQ